MRSLTLHCEQPSETTAKLNSHILPNFTGVFKSYLPTLILPYRLNKSSHNPFPLNDSLPTFSPPPTRLSTPIYERYLRFSKHAIQSSQLSTGLFPELRVGKELRQSLSDQETTGYGNANWQLPALSMSAPGLAQNDPILPIKLAADV